MFYRKFLDSRNYKIGRFECICFLTNLGRALQLQKAEKITKEVTRMRKEENYDELNTKYTALEYEKAREAMIAVEHESLIAKERVFVRDQSWSKELWPEISSRVVDRNEKIYSRVVEHDVFGIKINDVNNTDKNTDNSDTTISTTGTKSNKKSLSKSSQKAAQNWRMKKYRSSNQKKEELVAKLAGKENNENSETNSALENKVLLNLLKNHGYINSELKTPEAEKYFTPRSKASGNWLLHPEPGVDEECLMGSRCPTTFHGLSEYLNKNDCHSCRTLNNHPILVRKIDIASELLARAKDRNLGARLNVTSLLCGKELDYERKNNARSSRSIDNTPPDDLQNSSENSKNLKEYEFGSEIDGLKTLCNTARRLGRSAHSFVFDKERVNTNTQLAAALGIVFGSDKKKRRDKSVSAEERIMPADKTKRQILADRLQKDLDVRSRFDEIFDNLLSYLDLTETKLCPDPNIHGCYKGYLIMFDDGQANEFQSSRLSIAMKNRDIVSAKGDQVKDSLTYKEMKFSNLNCRNYNFRETSDRREDDIEPGPLGELTRDISLHIRGRKDKIDFDNHEYAFIENSSEENILKFKNQPTKMLQDKLTLWFMTRPSHCYCRPRTFPILKMRGDIGVDFLSEIEEGDRNQESDDIGRFLETKEINKYPATFKLLPSLNDTRLHACAFLDERSCRIVGGLEKGNYNPFLH